MPNKEMIPYGYGGGSSNQLLPFNALSNQLTQSGHPSALVYNAGQVYVDPNSSRHVAIYNAPGGQVHIGGGGDGGGIQCLCGKSFASQSEMKTHKQQFRYGCSQHGMCFGSWKQHVNSFSHSRCPVKDCANEGLDFGSDARFLQHFRKKHG